jgi:hypothetical protein
LAINIGFFNGLDAAIHLVQFGISSCWKKNEKFWKVVKFGDDIAKLCRYTGGLFPVQCIIILQPKRANEVSKQSQWNGRKF